MSQHLFWLVWDARSSAQWCHFLSPGLELHWPLGFLGDSDSKHQPEMQETWLRSLIWDDTLEGEMATCPRNSCLENSTDRGAWQAIVPGLAESWT